jgi:acetoin utilization protein AcuB
MTVGTIMSTDVRTVDAATVLADARTIMRSERIHHLVVVRKGRLAGVVSAQDLDRTGRGPIGRRVADVMASEVVTVTPGTTLRRASNLMRGRRIGCLVVTERGTVTGILTFADLLHLAGKGLTRPASKPRASLHFRVKHTKQPGPGRAW